MMHPVGFSSSQLSILLRAARPLSDWLRPRFLEALNDQLVPHAVLTDDTVSEAAAVVLSQMFSTGRVPQCCGE